MLMAEAIFQNDLVDDLSAEDASPSPEILMQAIKLFIDHHAFAAMTSHLGLLSRFRDLITSGRDRPVWSTR